MMSKLEVFTFNFFVQFFTLFPSTVYLYIILSCKSLSFSIRLSFSTTCSLLPFIIWCLIILDWQVLLFPCKVRIWIKWGLISHYSNSRLCILYIWTFLFHYISHIFCTDLIEKIYNIEKILLDFFLISIRKISSIKVQVYLCYVYKHIDDQNDATNILSYILSFKDIEKDVELVVSISR